MDFNDFNIAQNKLKETACKIAELNFPWGRGCEYLGAKSLNDSTVEFLFKIFMGGMEAIQEIKLPIDVANKIING